MNGMLVFRENWYERVVCFEEDSCRISRESNVPFPSAVDYTATIPSVVCFRLTADCGHNFLSAFPLSLQTNGTLEFRENWQERVVCFADYSCRISRESNVPFPSAVDHTANPPSVVLGAPPIAGTIYNAFNQPQRTNGTLHSDEIWQEHVVHLEEDSLKISQQSNLPFSSADRYTKPTIRYFLNTKNVTFKNGRLKKRAVKKIWLCQNLKKNCHAIVQPIFIKYTVIIDYGNAHNII